MTDERVLVGRIVKPHGIRGEVSIAVLSDVPGRFEPGTELDGPDGTLTVTSARPHQGRLLVRFAQISDRTSAELLRGVELRAAPVDLSDSDTYYVQELVGMRVVGPAGEELGHVADLIELPSAAGYDLLEVARDDGSTWLLPASDELVEVVEGATGDAWLALVDPPAGLVDLRDAATAADEEGA